MTPRSMDKTASRVSNERLAEMLAGLEGLDGGLTYQLPGDMRSIITELQSLRSSDSVSDGSKGVRVKPLEWEDDGIGLRAKGYRIERGNENIYVRSSEATGLFATIEFASSIEEAKGAAQADYEQRVLSALDSGTGGQQGNQPETPVPGSSPGNADRKGNQPAAYILSNATGETKLSMHPISDGDRSYGWEQTPLYLSPTEPKAGVVSEAFQARVAQAHIALFHDDPTDLAERRDRFGEEANELQQALGQTREEAHRLVDYTYDRPLGEPEKEVGSAALTLASLCVVGGWDMMACAEADLAALQTPKKIAKVRAKRATRHGRGPLPGLDPAAALPNTTGEAE